MLLGISMLVLLVLGYVASNYAITHSFTKGSGAFLPFFLAIVFSNWVFLPAGPSIHLTRETLRFDGWALLIRPREIRWRDIEEFGIERGVLWLSKRDRICWRLRPDHPSSRASLAVRLPNEPPVWDGKIDNIYGDLQAVITELETWRRQAA
jgi:hypothetical protein